MAIKVLIADDHPLLRYGLTTYLEEQPDIRVVAQAGDGDQVLREVERSRPEVLLLDVNDANRLASVEGVPYTWDNVFDAGKPGNLLSDGVYTYAYNHANQLASVSGAGNDGELCLQWPR